MSGLDWLYWSLVVGLFLALAWMILREPDDDQETGDRLFADDTELIPITEAALAEAATPPRIRIHPRRATAQPDRWDDKLNELLAEWTGPALTAREDLLLELDATNRLLRHAALLLDG